MIIGNKILKNRLCSSFCMAAILSSSFLSQYAYANDSIESETVYVTTSRVEQDLMSVPNSVSVVTYEDIQKNPATTIADLLQDIPGVEVFEGAPGLKRVSIRGESASRTLILVDGQKIADQKSMSGAPILVDPANVERIEIIRGPASVLYGSDAIGGVVNIITKKTTDKALSGSASVGFFSENNGFTESINVYGSKNGWNYNFAASNGNFGDRSTPLGTLPNSDYKQQDFRGQIGYTFNDMVSAGINASYFTSDVRTAGYDYSNGSYEAYATMDLEPWKTWKVAPYLEFKNVNDYLSRVRLDFYYQEIDKTFTNTMYGVEGTANGMTGIMDMLMSTVSDLDTMGASVQTDWTIGDNNFLIVGYEYYKDTLKSTDPTIMSLTIATSGTKLFDINQLSKSNSSQDNHALYASMETTLPSDFTLSYGMRYTYVKTKLDNLTVNTDTISTVFGNSSTSLSKSGSSSDSRPVFNVGLVWEGIENLALRANWAQGFRAPTLSEKYVVSGMMSTFIYGNPDLEAETSDNFEIGVRYHNQKITADIAAFYNIADNYITTVTRTDGSDDKDYVNIAKAKTYGLEASLKYSFANNITPYVWATLMRREFQNGTGFTTYDSGTPSLSGRVGVMYDTSIYQDRADINLNLYMRGQTGSTYASSETVSYYYPGFATLNLAMGLTFGQDKAWNVQAELNNILDKRYYVSTTAESGSAAEAGLNAALRVTYSF